jgi:predicted N-acyltransferase
LFTARTVSSIAAVPAADWDALNQRGVPFLCHAFLAAAESSRSVCPQTGWQPQHLLLEDAAGLAGAMPLYLKAHSWGEFVFDFVWAEAYSRHGLDYYPKLLSCTPFTPATGPRVLVAPGRDPATVRTAAAEALKALARAQEISSVHVQFLDAAEAPAFEAAGFLHRVACQFLWEDRGFADYDGFLATFTADKRKKAKRERRRVQEAGITFSTYAGAELDEAGWDTVYEFYADTFRRRGNEPYLNRAFFTEIVRTLPGQPIVKLARLEGAPVAVAVFFTGADTLYGRYWGAAEALHSLHFEACYHQGVELALERGLRRFEPGTQGEHKVARGFSPTLTHSVHWLADERFHEAVGRYVAAETRQVQQYASVIGEHVPFKAEPIPVDVAMPGERLDNVDGRSRSNGPDRPP